MNKIVSLNMRRDVAKQEELRKRLPSPDTRRWVASRKAAVVAAVDAGAISRDDAKKMYRLSDEELDTWCESLSQHGVPALYATRIQVYRNTQNE